MCSHISMSSIFILSCEKNGDNVNVTLTQTINTNPFFICFNTYNSSLQSFRALKIKFDVDNISLETRIKEYVCNMWSLYYNVMETNFIRNLWLTLSQWLKKNWRMNGKQIVLEMKILSFQQKVSLFWFVFVFHNLYFALRIHLINIGRFSFYMRIVNSLGFLIRTFYISYLRCLWYQYIALQLACSLWIDLLVYIVWEVNGDFLWSNYKYFFYWKKHHFFYISNLTKKLSFAL